jgi:hypothetical protein
LIALNKAGSPRIQHILSQMGEAVGREVRVGQSIGDTTNRGAMRVTWITRMRDGSVHRRTRGIRGLVNGTNVPHRTPGESPTDCHASGFYHRHHRTVAAYLWRNKVTRPIA